jgi:NodT family efflux transporter outer membrane factor (OMF) lipoprotein
MIKCAIHLTCCLMLASLVSGCAVGPDYENPEVLVPLAYKEASSEDWKMATPQDSADRGKWWLVFNDPILNELEDKATECNQNIAVARAQYDKALALVDAAKAGFFPLMTASIADRKANLPGGSTTTSVTNVQSLTGSSAASGANTSAARGFSAGYQATWEPDLWGSVRRLVESEEAAAQASEAQLANVKLATQGTLAQTYFQLRALDEAKDVYDESVAAYEKFLKLTKNQYKAGTASQLAIMQADSQLQAIKVQAIDIGVARAQYEHAIAILIDTPPSNFSIPRRKSQLVPPKVPEEIPSALLERRPDIANAERLVAQANARIGVATAAFYPTLTLSGSKIFQATSFPKLFSAPIIAWSLGAQLAQTVFDGGTRWSALESSKADYLVTVGTYRQTVLAAFQDVEDNLSNLRILNQESAAQASAVRAAEKQSTYTLNEYKAGTASSLDVLNALFLVYSAKINATNIASRQMTAAAGLIKALGGGACPIVPECAKMENYYIE